MKETYRESAEVISRAWPDWEIRDLIGTGAFATVYRASRRERIPGEKDSAIKIIRIPHVDTDWDRMLAEGKTPEQTEDFFQHIVDDSLKEIRAMEELSGHTNIVNIFDYKRYHVPDQHVWYILIRMELLEKVDTGKLDEKEVVRLGTDVCTALSICRKKNIVHRDISLDNIFIHDGSYKLGDFGVAKVLEGTMGNLQSIAGKPLYMAPEIYNATLTETDIDSAARVDIYSLGILLYRLTHHMNYPFEDPDTPNISASERSNAFRRRVIEGEALPPPEYASPDLAVIILKACMPDPSKRYDNVNDMREDLQTLTVPRFPQQAPRKNSVWSHLSTRKKGIILAIAILMLMLIAAGIWYMNRLSGTDPDSKKEAETDETALEIPGLESGMYHIILTGRDIGVVNFYDTKDLVDKRLDIFTKDLGGFQSSANEREGRIDLLVPRKAFENMNVENVLNACLVRPTVLYALNGKNYQSYIEIGRDSLESVTLHDGRSNGFSPADYSVYHSSDQYIELVLTDEFASAHENEILSWDNLVFALDYEQYRNQTWYYFSRVVPAEDGKTYYLFPTDMAKQFNELLCHNLQTPPLPDALDYTIDLNYLTSWQKTEDTARPGQYQCDFQNVPEESVTIQYSTSSREREGATLDIENEMKARLDIMETPYAFGISHGEKNSYFSVKIPSCKTGLSLMSVLTSSELIFRAGLLEFRCSYYDLNSDLSASPYDLLIILENKKIDYIQKLAKEARQHDNFIYISYNDYSPPLFAFSADDIREDGTIVISHYCEVSNGHLIVHPMDSTHVWLFTFMRALSLRTDSVSLPSKDIKWQVNSVSGAAIPSQPAFSVSYDMNLKKLEKSVKDICPAAIVKLSGSYYSSLQISLNLFADNTLPDKVPEMARQIYESIDYPNLLIHNLYIYIFDHKANYDAYISFSKKINRVDRSFDLDSGYIYVNGDFSNSRLAPYRKKIIENIESMEFFQNLTQNDTHWTITRGQKDE